MGRRDGPQGRYHSTKQKGKGDQGRKVMKTRREASGMDKAAFEAMIRRLGIQVRAS